MEKGIQGQRRREREREREGEEEEKDYDEVTSPPHKYFSDKIEGIIFRCFQSLHPLSQLSASSSLCAPQNASFASLDLLMLGYLRVILCFLA